MNQQLLALTLTATTMGTISSAAEACTRALYHSDALDTTMVTRSMDWEGYDQAVVRGIPRGTVLDTRAPKVYGVDLNKSGVANQAYKSKYAMIEIASFDAEFVTEAINEHGVLGQIHYLNTDWQEEKALKKGNTNIDGQQFVQYVVANAKNLDEVQSIIKNTNIRDQKLGGVPGLYDANTAVDRFLAHFIFADNSGETILVEMVNGEKRFYRGAGSLDVISNNPTFDTMAEIDKELMGEKRFPTASINSLDRRHRAQYALEEVKAYEERFGIRDNKQLGNIIEGVAHEMRSGYTKWDVAYDMNFPTLWVSQVDLKNKTLKLDRWDTDQIEQYDFAMFDVDGKKVVELGRNPNGPETQPCTNINKSQPFCAK
ncbi:linear amide C-N hydrolase [Vibrio neptunius]|uniref:Linear amide C-N hydrolase n=1 Tax=Vibrio neptunius TaxID=170651 RepID=A0ABS3A5P2_9VIBR|nr:linear amide C-N hydrolase [Vibrio neptunius]MBN3494942.1 linear amide C-N hydrolase [Vibrio neptunius]MBN3517362.1 linear amide C-N hydrolase [Vibrio neptunius]MBN3551814.1 linear amide C-N hydrolase [Vibrio neptunius]MBN3579806.1 linear amide C-N hydrolase [Vibrio neptunius]MCH9873472.1 linear amide C-N hydrolase [Vibrio neptunius]